MALFFGKISPALKQCSSNRKIWSVVVSFALPDQLCKCSLASEVLRCFGRLRLQVTGASMLPSLWPGDVLLIRGAQFDEVSLGDLIFFFRDNRFFVHRAVGVSGNRLLTQGDGLAAPDLPVGRGELLGRVAFISRDGVMRQPSPLGIAGRLLAFGVRRSTTFSSILLRVQPICRRFLRPPTLAPMPHSEEA
jgi:hypothetical protein